MTVANRIDTRRGFTLIELLVVMALIAGLAAMAMIVAPGAMNKDRAATAVSQIQSALQISRARAIRDGTPRGVRFLWNGSNNVTEYQYIESPPLFVPNPGAPIGVAPYNSPPPNTGANAPYVQFNYPTLANGSVPVLPAGRGCTIINLNAADQAQVFSGGTMYLPTLGTWHRFLGPPNQPTPVAPPPGAMSAISVTLDSYPDQQLGAETQWRTYHFGLNGGPRALLGEPTVQLPQATCVDLSLSSPGGGGQDYDILFAPSGLLTGGSTAGAGQVFLWVRDPAKPANLQQGGEQLIVSIKAKSGGIGAAPVDWGADPFILAKRSLSGQ